MELREPLKRSRRGVARVTKKMERNARFAALVGALRQLASEHMATPSNLRQALSFVAREREWRLYAISQGRVQKIKHDELEESELGDDEGYGL